MLKVFQAAIHTLSGAAIRAGAWLNRGRIVRAGAAAPLDGLEVSEVPWIEWLEANAAGASAGV